MSKPRFPLQAALRVRQLAVEREEAQLQVLHAERERLQQEVVAAARSAHQTREQLQQDPQSWVPYLSFADRHVMAMQRRQESLQSALQQQHARIQEQQSRVRQARQAAELLVRMRDRAALEWQREEAKRLEELAAESYLSRLARER